MLETKSRYLLFINTKTGETNRVDFSNDAIMEKVEQIKNDNLNLNVIVVSARTVDLDGKKGNRLERPDTNHHIIDKR